jgi:hypothetical protein
MNNFSPSNTDFRINGYALTSWGTGQPPLTIEPIDASGTLIRGEGGGAVALYRDNFGWRVTVNLLPGTKDSAYLKTLKKARTALTFSHTVIGTLEVGAGTNGIFVSEGALGRASTSQVSDDIYTMEFNNADLARGGDE